MNRPANSDRKALKKWLLDTVTSSSAGTRLPSDRTLGNQFGLSRVSVARTLSELAREGVVVRVQGSGTYVAPYAPDRPHAPPSLPVARAVDRLEQRLRRMLIDGTVRHGESLPAIKYLTHTYRVSRRTVSAAYHRLMDEGLVVKMGRGFWHASPRDLVGPAGRREVYFFVHDQQELSEVFVSHDLSVSLRVMEDLLSTHGFVVRFSFYADLPRLARGWHLSPPAAVFCANVAADTYAALRTQLLPVMRRHRRHLHVLVDWRALDIDTKPRPFLHVSRLDATLARVKVGTEFLTRRGVRAADFVVRQADFYRLQLGSFLLYDFMWLRAELKRVSPDFDYRLVVIRERPGHTKEGFFAAADTGALLRAAGWYSPVRIEDLQCETVFVDSVDDILPPRARHLTYFVQKAEDAVALITSLEARGIAVPDGARVLTTHDAPRYYHYGITRCEIDWQSVGHVMAHALMGDRPVRTSPDDALEVQARVLEKTTT